MVYLLDSQSVDRWAASTAVKSVACSAGEKADPTVWNSAAHSVWPSVVPMVVNLVDSSDSRSVGRWAASTAVKWVEHLVDGMVDPMVSN